MFWGELSGVINTETTSWNPNHIFPSDHINFNVNWILELNGPTKFTLWWTYPLHNPLGTEGLVSQVQRGCVLPCKMLRMEYNSSRGDLCFFKRFVFTSPFRHPPLTSQPNTSQTINAFRKISLLSLFVSDVREGVKRNNWTALNYLSLTLSSITALVKRCVRQAALILKPIRRLNRCKDPDEHRITRKSYYVELFTYFPPSNFLRRVTDALNCIALSQRERGRATSIVIMSSHWAHVLR